MAEWYSWCSERGREPERRKLAWMWLSMPKGRDVEDMESDEGGMAQDCC